MTETPLPPPQLALGVAIAGKRDLQGQGSALESRLHAIFAAIAQGLDGIRAAARGGHLAGRFDSAAKARLTLVNGLADGADQLAGRVFLAAAGRHAGVDHVLGAILPCNREDFVANSAIADEQAFAEQYEAAAFVIELDGAMPLRPADGADAPDDREARDRAFASQSAFLLRHADILIAVDDPQSRGKIGGTQDTIRAARERAIPVILVQLDGSVRILQTPRDFDRMPAPLDEPAGRIVSLVEALIGVGRPQDDYADETVDSYFNPKGPDGHPTIRAWQWFESWFAPGAAAAVPAGSPPQGPHRLRASMLARRHAGLYRGTILTGYALAVVAVGLAVGALVTMLLAPKAHDYHYWEWWLLLLLAALKLAALIAILRLIDSGNRRRLGHCAADYRYLSERLRSMVYLPLIGSLRPPPHPSRPYSTRVESQSVIDRLFDAIVRQIDPLAAMGPREGKIIRPDAAMALRSVKADWLDQQVAYHERNKQTLLAMSERLEKLGHMLNRVVIGIVAIDLAIILLASRLSEPLEKLAHNPIALIFASLAAILPAAVASLNGIRFQTECARLSDRSAQMSVELRHIQSAIEKADERANLVDVLRVAEDISRLTLDEVADWSGTYGKELVDP